MPSFQLRGLPHQPFEPLFDLSDQALRQIGARRCVASEAPGYPCRVSLQEAAAGEELLLLPFEHQPALSPYRSSGPIYVRRDARQQVLPAGVVPPIVTSRLMSVRAYDAQHMIVAATVCEGTEVAQAIRQFFADGAVDYIHLHNAKRGCFSCRVDRA